MDSDRIMAVYEEISKYVIKLEPDPASLGPKYLADSVARCRNYLNAVSCLIQEVHQERHIVQRDLTALAAAYDIEASDLLANDDRVRRLPNIDDRKATVSVLLRDRLRAIQELRGIVEDLDIVDKAVRFRHRELKDTMSEIRVQRSLIRDELDSKSFYGDERTGDTGGRAAGVDVAELEALLDESASKALEDGTSVSVLLCSICGEPKYETLSGLACVNRCDDAEPLEDIQVQEEVVSSELTDADFDAILQNI